MEVTEASIRTALAYLARQPAPPLDDAGFNAAMGCLITLLHVVDEQGLGPPGAEPVVLQAQWAARRRLGAEALWCELRAVERIAEEATTALDGDPLVDGVTARLRQTREAVESIASPVRRSAGSRSRSRARRPRHSSAVHVAGSTIMLHASGASNFHIWWRHAPCQ